MARVSRSVLPALAALVGCAGAPACPEGQDCATPEDTGTGFQVEAPEPVWSLEELGEVLESFVSYGPPNAQDVMESWVEVLSSGDAFCPGGSTEYLVTALEGCDTQEGAHYAGIGDYVIYETYNDNGNEVPLVFYHWGDYQITRTDGTRFAGGGEIDYASELFDTDITFEVYMRGSWVDESRDGFLGAAFSGIWEAEGTYDVASEAFDVWVNGGVALGAYDVSLVDMRWDTAGDCAGAPSGTIKFRDERGYWTTWTLDEGCDGCGAVVFHEDTALGELCADLSGYGQAWAEANLPR